MRGEPITYTELMEILGVEEFETGEEKLYELDEKWVQLDHSDLLEHVVMMLDND
jgi:hypothetical protein